MNSEDEAQDKSPGFDRVQRPPAALGERDQPGVNYIIAIGIDTYQRADLRLYNCVKDCKDLITTLRTEFKYFSVYQELYDTDATKKKIHDCLTKFCADKDANSPLNSLLIYYSGHGASQVLSPTTIRGAWVPYEYDNDPGWELYHLDDLLLELEPVKTRNLLVIADSCYAARLFQRPLAEYPASKAPISNEITDLFDAYRWGLVASGTQEKAKAGAPGTNSVFTASLLRTLKENNAAKPLFRTLADGLIREYLDKDGQTVKYNQLNSSADNTGEFMLEANENLLTIRQRYSYLEKEIKDLNYDDQKVQFLDFESFNQRVQFTFFSGTPTCGLYFLAGLARASQFIPRHKWIPINPQLIRDDKKDKDERLLNILSLITKEARPYTSLDQLKQYLYLQLSTDNVLIEIRFYPAAPAPVDITPLRRQFVADLTDFAQEINKALQTGNQLYIFVVDLENADYKSIVPKDDPATPPAVVMEKVRALTKIKFKLWYNQAQTRYLVNGKSQFKILFDNVVFNQLPAIFMEKDEQYPAHVIQQVCVLSDCSDLANKLLNQ